MLLFFFYRHLIFFLFALELVAAHQNRTLNCARQRDNMLGDNYDDHDDNNGFWLIVADVFLVFFLIQPSELDDFAVSFFVNVNRELRRISYCKTFCALM